MTNPCTHWRAGTEPAETLGDTHPGELDEGDLLQHPALAQADDDMRTPWWGYPLLAIAFVAACAGSAVFPWGLPPTP